MDLPVIGQRPEPPTEATPSDLLMLAELRAAAANLPWAAMDGRLYTDDGAPEPWNKPATLIARFSGEREQAVTNAQAAAQVFNFIGPVMNLAEQRLREAQNARSAAARLADAIDSAVDSGQVDSEAADALKAAVSEWEQSIREAGMTIAHGPAIKGGGVLHTPLA